MEGIISSNRCLSQTEAGDIGSSCLNRRNRRGVMQAGLIELLARSPSSVQKTLHEGSWLWRLALVDVIRSVSRMMEEDNAGVTCQMPVNSHGNLLRVKGSLKVSSCKSTVKVEVKKT